MSNGSLRTNCSIPVSAFSNHTSHFRVLVSVVCTIFLGPTHNGSSKTKAIHAGGNRLKATSHRNAAEQSISSKRRSSSLFAVLVTTPHMMSPTTCPGKIESVYFEKDMKIRENTPSRVPLQIVLGQYACREAVAARGY